MAAPKKKLIIIIVACVIAVAVAAGITIPLILANKKELSLAQTYANYFKIGAALPVDYELKDCGYEDEFLAQFSSFTAENVMKWRDTEPQKGVYTYELGDYVVNKARELGVGVRGHALVWRDSMPDYLSNDCKSLNKNNVINDIREHVYTTIEHFGDDVVYCWDVVNEAISDSTNEDEIYYPCPLYEAAGEDYIFEAFKAAYAAAQASNLNIKLYYNDYNLHQPVKRAKAIKMIKRMQEQGIPIDGIGDQGHYNIRNFDPVLFEDMINDFRALGLEVQITELDFSVYADYNEKMFEGLPEELSKLQAECYAQLFEICRKNKDIVKAVTFWGVADDYTWLDNHTVKGRKDYPLIFDEFLDRKDAYYAIVDFEKGYTLDKDKAENPDYNVYDGKSATFNIGNWYGDELEGFTLDPDAIAPNGEQATKVSYYKQSEYSEVIAKVTGELGNFRYLNITLSADKDTVVMAQINYYIGRGEDNDKVLGEKSFEIGTEKKTYSIKIPDSKIPYLNLVDEVWLFPEPGEMRNISGRALYGDVYIYSTNMTATQPTGSTLIEPAGTGNGVVEKEYRKAGQHTWYNETTWTRIMLNRTNEGMQIYASGAADWAFVSVQLEDFDLEDNMLKIRYKDPTNSVSYFRFRLRGTPTGMTSDGTNTYMTYYDKDLVDYVIDVISDDHPYEQPSKGGPDSVEYDEQTGVYTIYYSIGDYIEELVDEGGIDLSEDGYGLRLVILIETVGVDGKTKKDYSPKYPSNYSDEDLRGERVNKDKKFDVTILEVDTYKE